jgi:hypothetical protein
MSAETMRAPVGETPIRRHYYRRDRISVIGGQLGRVRQLGRRTSAIGEELMKAKTRAKAGRPKDFSAGVGRALRRAAKDARKIARMYRTPVYVLKNGKVVAEKP